MSHEGHFFVCKACGYVGEERELPPDPNHAYGKDQCPECGYEGCICCCFESEEEAERGENFIELTACELAIRLSIQENRTVTEYPATEDEYEGLVDGLRAECDDDCPGDVTSGEGCSGPEARGWADYWGTRPDGEWRVNVVRPATTEKE